MNNSDKKIVLPRPKLPSPPSPSTPTQNRFIALTPHPPTYSSIARPAYSALARLQGMPHSPVPYTRSPTIATSPLPSIPRSPSNKPEFQINPHKHIIKILKPIEEQKLSHGFPSLMEYIFSKDAKFYNNDYQTRMYYEAVLTDSQSVQIRHNYNKDKPEEIDFSKVKIMKVLSPEDWGNRTFTNKVLSCYPDYHGYNYYDYIEAWNKAFLLKAHYHTWFFHFSENFSLRYPRWLYNSQLYSNSHGYYHLHTRNKKQKEVLHLYYLDNLVLNGGSISRKVKQTKKQLLSITVALYKSLQKPFTPRRPMTNDEVAKRIRDCKSDEDLIKIINEIRSSPTPKPLNQTYPCISEQDCKQDLNNQDCESGDDMVEKLSDDG
nr:enzymatic polyprotein [Tanacetum cinerariifolium]